jgi:hypothetical protein
MATNEITIGIFKFAEADAMQLAATIAAILVGCGIMAALFVYRKGSMSSGSGSKASRKSPIKVDTKAAG